MPLNAVGPAALQAGSLKDMAGVWGSGEQVQCVHPGAGCIAGREAVSVWLGAGLVAMVPVECACVCVWQGRMVGDEETQKGERGWVYMVPDYIPARHPPLQSINNSN